MVDWLVDWLGLRMQKNLHRKRNISGNEELLFVKGNVFLLSASCHDSGCGLRSSPNTENHTKIMREANTRLHGTSMVATAVFSPTEETECNQTENLQPSHPVDDLVAVKFPEFRGSHDDGGSKAENRVTQRTSTVQAYQSCAEIKAVHPVTNKNEPEISNHCQQLGPAKKVFDGDDPDYNDDEYLHIVRGITSVPHDFAPERVVTPVYTVPRYPDNHNPLLPLSLQKKLGKDIRPH